MHPYPHFIHQDRQKHRDHRKTEHIIPEDQTWDAIRKDLIQILFRQKEIKQSKVRTILSKFRNH